MLIHVRLLEALLGPYSSHVELVFSQERRVPYPAQKEHAVFGSCRERLCWDHIRVMLSFVKPRAVCSF